MNSSLLSQDPQIAEICALELKRQQDQLEMIASENFTSRAVMETQGSALTNKYAEGYPGARYYGGCEFVDQAEQLAINRAKELFKCDYINVQPHSGSQANLEVFYALLNPGDTILGMSLNSGGHLTHGARVSFSGKWFNAIGYSVKSDTGLIDYDQVRELAHAHQPRLIIAGASSYPRQIDFEFFQKVAQEIGAYFMVDMAHIAGLVAGDALPSPLPFADVVTTTTHKTLRGPRGGMILAQTDALAKKFNSAVFPGNQGGPLMHVIAAKAVAFGEALRPEFKQYAQQIIKNAQALGEILHHQGINITTQGTDCHLVLVDLRSLGISGKLACDILEQAGITCNKNSVPFDQASPQETSGIRLGSPALTTRGLKETEFKHIGEMIAQILKGLSAGQESDIIQKVKHQVQGLCRLFPLYD
ncbi:MAG: serine hydroxymethyltransferase [Janthinobacterium lividum]